MTAAVIIITGVLGNVLAEPVLRLFRIGEPVAKGIALGTASHASELPGPWRGGRSHEQSVHCGIGDFDGGWGLPVCHVLVGKGRRKRRGFCQNEQGPCCLGKIVEGLIGSEGVKGTARRKLA